MEEDFNPASPPTVVLSHRLWSRSFGGDAEIIGRQVKLNGYSHAVIAVMPSHFQFVDRGTEFWLPRKLPAGSAPSARELASKAYLRAREGIGKQQIQMEATNIAELVARSNARGGAEVHATVTPLHEAVVSNAEPKIYLLLGAAGFVLLIACLNVANLLLACIGAYGVTSYSVKQRRFEIGIRKALGAGEHDIVRKFVGEGAFYIVIGLLAGLACAFAATGLLAGFLYEIEPTDPPTYATITLLLLACSLLAVYLPVCRAAKAGPATILRRD